MALQVLVKIAERAVDAAVASNHPKEAGDLQAEADAETLEAAQLAASFGFSAVDIYDLPGFSEKEESQKQSPSDRVPRQAPDSANSARAHAVEVHRVGGADGDAGACADGPATPRASEALGASPKTDGSGSKRSASLASIASQAASVEVLDASSHCSLPHGPGAAPIEPDNVKVAVGVTHGMQSWDRHGLGMARAQRG